MYFLVKTENPRPTFHIDMTQDERGIMEKHVKYWMDKVYENISVVFGPVIDPQGVYGIGICRVKDVEEMKRLIDNDPAKGLLKYEMFQMPKAVVAQDILESK